MIPSWVHERIITGWLRAWLREPVPEWWSEGICWVLMVVWVAWR